MIKSIIKLIRPYQWVKNGFVLLPLFFSGQLLNAEKVELSIVAFFMFAFVASSIYCFNDAHDADADRLHPKKKFRPVASGAVSKPMAYTLTALMLALSLGLGLLLPSDVRLGSWTIILVYFALNIAYSLKLKRISIIDVAIVSIGFVLRVEIGGYASGIAISNWIIIMTFLLALFLALAKRRDDVVIYEETGAKMRDNIIQYNSMFINLAITIVGTITIVAYIMYTMSPSVVSNMGSDNIYITSFFVLLGILRYMQITLVDEKSGNPTSILYKDKFIVSCVLGWVVTFAVILYC